MELPTWLQPNVLTMPQTWQASMSLGGKRESEMGDKSTHQECSKATEEGRNSLSTVADTFLARLEWRQYHPFEKSPCHHDLLTLHS
mmetsp:Transcript_52285/g.87278  ORF Transcript_52285/g.87278 Transcript_52285/m.87278 type:complete len:86 (+) Transcript_52285:302-559(+)